MEFFSKKLLCKKNFVPEPEYTFKVVTNPTSASCTITYEGVEYTTKSLKVKAGSVISYSIYHSTYGTTTGSVTMSKDRTLTCTGVKTTKTEDVAWSQPTLNANGTVGGSKFAVVSNGELSANFKAFQAFDNKPSTFWLSTAFLPKYIIFYCPTALRVSNLKIYNDDKASIHLTYVKDYTIYASNNNSSWTTLKTGTNTNYTIGGTWNIPINTGSYYKYYKINVVTCKTSGGPYANIAECKITATYQKTTTTYSWNKSLS